MASTYPTPNRRSQPGRGPSRGPFPRRLPPHRGLPLPPFQFPGSALRRLGRFALGRHPLTNIALELFDLWLNDNPLQHLPGGVVRDLPGATLDCGKPHDVVISGGQTICRINQALIPGWPTSPTATSVTIWHQHPPVTGLPKGAVYDVAATYPVPAGLPKVWPRTLPKPNIETWPNEMPEVVPAVFPQADPWHAPAPGVPVPVPAPVPYPAIPGLPTHSPLGDPIRGPIAPRPPALPRAPGRPAIRPRPRTRPLPRPGPSGNPSMPPEPPGPPSNLPPNRLPANELAVSPGKAPSLNQGYHHQAPPPANTKEGKWAASAGGSPIAFAAHAGSEYSDFIDALYDALPREVKQLNENLHKDQKRIGGSIFSEGPGLNAKAKAVYNHFNQINGAKAIKNLAANGLIDRAIGTLAQGGRRTAHGMGLSKGFGLGPAI